MKRITWLILVATVALPLLTGYAQTQTAQVPALSPAAAEVVKLAQSGTSEDVLLAYIQNSPSTFSLSADQILYLKDIGVSSQAISSMLNRDATLHNQPQQYSYDQKNYPPANNAPTEPAPAAAAPVATAPPAPVPTEAPPPVAAPAPAYVSSAPADVSYFYQDLSPYGTWVDLPGYGWCWQPTVVVVNRGWSPYCDAGHWVWSDAGWFWASDYSWGWAPFHYGRWYHHDHCGWVWTPDRVWGPAWVTWRSSGACCGWAPLPPHAVFDVHLGWSFNGVHVGLSFDFGVHPEHYTFVGYHDFCAHDLGHMRMAPVEVTKVYHTTVINNNYVVNNNTIVNQGVQVERVAAASHTEIHKAAIRDLPAGSPRGVQHVADKSGSVVYRSQLRAPAQPVKMVAQKVDERHPVIQHTEVAPAVRAASKSTATPSHTAAASSSAWSTQTPKSTTRSSSSTAPASARQSEQPKSVARYAVPSATTPAKGSSPAARQPVEQAKPATHAMPGYNPSAEPRTYPLRTTQSPASDASSSSHQGQNSHIYYPKTYHQSSDVRALPPANAPYNGPSYSGNGSSTPAKKN